MKIFGLAGWSGSGKTTLLTRLLPELIGRGYAVSTVKHAHHNFDIDKPGKDSFEHRRAGATEVMVSSANRWALMHEIRDTPELNLEALVARMSPVDLLLVEGFKRDSHAKLEIHRPSVGKELLCLDDPYIVAVASDEAIPKVCVPVLDLDDVPTIANFILAHVGLMRSVPLGAA
jgi:molybdopterin-guanine dinucleotide biosynthesis protein B